jgi:hypothetical protein
VAPTSQSGPQVRNNEGPSIHRNAKPLFQNTENATGEPSHKDLLAPRKVASRFPRLMAAFEKACQLPTGYNIGDPERQEKARRLQTAPPPEPAEELPHKKPMGSSQVKTSSPVVWFLGEVLEKLGFMTIGTGSMGVPPMLPSTTAGVGAAPSFPTTTGGVEAPLSRPVTTGGVNVPPTASFAQRPLPAMGINPQALAMGGTMAAGVGGVPSTQGINSPFSMAGATMPMIPSQRVR